MSGGGGRSENVMDSPYCLLSMHSVATHPSRVSTLCGIMRRQAALSWYLVSVPEPLVTIVSVVLMLDQLRLLKLAAFS